MTSFSRWTMVGLVGAALAGCGGGGGDAHEAHEVSAEYAGDIRSADTARGQEVYANVCGACHDGGAPQLADLGWEPARMRQQVREGEDRMPAISESRVSADDLEAVLAYMTTIGAVSGALPGADAAGGDTGGDTGGEAPVEGDEGTATDG